MTAPSGASFRDRHDGAGAGEARRRHPSARPIAELERRRDPLGKMALFSAETPARPFGTVSIDCSECGRETPVTALEAARAALPFSLHVPVIRRYHSLMRCPACGRRTWVRLRWTLQ